MSNKSIPKKINLHEFLGYFDFDYEVIPYDETNTYEMQLRKEKISAGEFAEKDIYKPMFSFIDLQGAYLGEIDKERYLLHDNLVEKILDRLDAYINDSVYSEFYSELRNRNIDADNMTFEEMWLKAKALNLTDGEVCYALASHIIHPESIHVDELEQNKIKNLITAAEKKQEQNNSGANGREYSKSEVEFHH